MNTTNVEENPNPNHEKPGMLLARLRETKGYSQEYIAQKLHLRVRIIELLESDSYQSMPEPVFIKGYIRAYAKLLSISPEPLLSAFNNLNTSEKRSEKALWQSKREMNRGEGFVRWITGIVALIVIIAVGLWWQKNKDNQPLEQAKTSQNEPNLAKNETEVRLTDLSKMHSLFQNNPNKDQLSLLERERDR